MRKLLGAMLACWAAVALAVGGCARAGAPRQPGRAAVSVDLGTTGTPALRLACDELDAGALQEALQLWEAQHPEAPVALAVPSPGSPPADVSICAPERFRELLRGGELLDLTPFVVRDSYDVGDFDWRTLDLFKADDRLYGLPMETGAEVLYYNADLFGAGGLTPPTQEWTWDTFLTAARALTRDLDGNGLADQYGFLCPGGASGQWLPWVWGAGGEVLDESGTRCLIDQPAAVEGMAFYAGLVTRQRVALPVWEDRGDPWLGEDLFATGRVGMCVGPPEFAARGAGFPDINWGIVSLPRGPATRASRIAARAYVVSAGSTCPDEAWEIAKFLATPAVESLLARHYKVPPRQSLILAGPALTGQSLWDERVFSQAVRDARPEPLLAAQQPIRDLVCEDFDLLLRGRVAPADAATRMRRRIDEALRATSTY